MAIEKMRLVEIISDKEHLQDVLTKFSASDEFHPELANKFASTTNGLSVLNEENPYAPFVEKVDNLIQTFNLVDEEGIEKPYPIQDIRSFIDDIMNDMDELHSVKGEVESVINDYQGALKQLEFMEHSEIDFDDVFSCRYIKVRFGRLPNDAVEKLSYFSDRPFIFQTFSQDAMYQWCAYFTTLKYEGEVDDIFSSLYFERIRIPDFVHGTSHDALEELKEEISDNEKLLDMIYQKIEAIKSKSKDTLISMKLYIHSMDKTFEARKYVLCLGERFSIKGFVPVRELEKFKARFQSVDGISLEDFPSDSDKRISPPTKLRNNWFARPFEMFVEMYGVPGYNDFDPTPFVALTYCILFGIMFGDLGQGLVLIIVGFLAAKFKKMRLGEIGMRIGVTSAFFGFWYGSFFGNEELLTPVFKGFGMVEKPFHILDSNFTMPLLITAVAIGSSLILISMLINIFSNLKRKEYGEVLFSHNGIAGFVFYAALLGGVAVMFTGGASLFTTPYILLLIVLPLILIFLKEPLERLMKKKKMLPDGFGGFFTVSFFELFEVLLTFIANTMSYLRIGGFVLSHAGMMLVVMTLSEMVGGMGSPVVIILGNIFVMCLEGMIVGIQVLRLEFYEMFSRYYDGNGVAFRTFKNE